MTIRPLVNLIKRIEAPRGYDQLNGYLEQIVGRHKLTSMTLGEIKALQRKGRAAGAKSTAAGQYQILLSTLEDLMRTLGLRDHEVFSPALQDLMAITLMEKRGLKEYKAGTLSEVAFANDLAREWASLPVVTAIRGRWREVKPGESYYSGDKLNKSLASPAEFLNTIRQITDVVPVEVPIIEEPRSMWWSFLVPILMGQLRHLLTAGGGALVGTGYVSGDEATTLVGAATTLVGAILSIFSKVLNPPISASKDVPPTVTREININR